MERYLGVDGCIDDCFGSLICSPNIILIREEEENKRKTTRCDLARGKDINK